MRITKYLITILFTALSGCQTLDRASEKLLDEELLVKTLTSELDSKKDAALEKLRYEVEEASRTITADINKQVVQELMDRVDKILVETTDRLVQEIRMAETSLNRKHTELLGRLPWYGLYLVLLMWGASLVDDIFRWLVGRVKNGHRIQ